MNYELSERERGLIKASCKAFIDLIKQSGKGKELVAEYEALFKKLG